MTRPAIVHDYFEVDWDEVYRTATRDIPPLEAKIRAILAFSDERGSVDDRAGTDGR